MARDYARKQSSGKGAVNSSPPPRKTRVRAEKSRKPSPRPAAARKQSGGLSVRWILSLAAVGAFIGFIVYLNTLEPVDGAAPEQRQPAVSQPSKPATSKPEQNTEQGPKFKFYDMLPESEVVPPTVEEYTPSPATQDFRYLVQAGSFRTAGDAERQRAQIAFQGLQTKVSQITTDEGKTWYRVNVGPFDSRSQMNSAVDKLVAINIQPLVRKIPKE
ncbi:MULTISPECIES: SPOR domain-containing protein [Marinobacter]|uniref:Cell division protein FtsN n=1 Tax=Marinobacter segnicrescens TaxID=430453 RepID=A0A1I0DY77_9GAMM|nr:MULTISPECIES: SPOR domain-containing protein [Marinobacter]UZD66676.1 SPOR domain-containing protein [Marinobacter sp. AN1]SET37392.1 cell division protein FtsN [Marinobacter segnicrescens]